LLFRYGQLGDTLVALPAIRAVREEFPDAELTLLCDKHPEATWVVAQQVLPPGLVDNVLTYEANFTTMPFQNALKLWIRLRRERSDKLIYLVPRQRSRLAVMRDITFFGMAGLTDISGFRGMAPLVVRKRPLPTVEYESESLLRRLRISDIGLSVRAPNFSLSLTDSERAEALRWLQARLTPADTTLVALCPGSKWPSKRWPEERYAILGAKLIQEFSVTPVVIVGAKDRAI